MRAIVLFGLWVCRVLPAGVVALCMRLLFRPTQRRMNAAARAPATAQRRRLKAIIERNAQTVFGQEHRFADITDFDTYRANVPLSTYDTMQGDIERTIAGEKNLRTVERAPFYATTSGTTGRSKYIPMTSAFVQSCKTTNRILFRTMLTTFPQLLQGKRLSMRSPKTERLGEDSRKGSITVALGGGLEQGAHPLDAVPFEVFQVADFRARYFLCLRFALSERVTVCAAINPSTLFLFQKTLKERGPELAEALASGTLGPTDVVEVLDAQTRQVLEAKTRPDRSAAKRVHASIKAHGAARMADVFEHLSGLICWKGGSAPFYLSRLPESYGDLPVLDYGYAASEGIFGAPLSADGAASLLSPHGHVFEFVPEAQIDSARAASGPTCLLHELEVGKNYYVIVTTSAGLYRYDMNDVITVVGRYKNAPLVTFSHKGGAQSSLTGEKLSESQVVAAMAEVQDTLQLTLGGFVVAPMLPEGDQEGAYLVAVEAAADDVLIDAQQCEQIAHHFDIALSARNEEYEAKRRSLRLDAAQCVVLEPAATARYRAKRVAGGAPDAHVKIPHLSADGALIVALGLRNEFEGFAARFPINVATSRTAPVVAEAQATP